MNQPWYIKFGWWLCEKTGHLMTDSYYQEYGQAIEAKLKEKNT